MTAGGFAEPVAESFRTPAGEAARPPALSRALPLLAILAFAFAWRVATFGNPTLHMDDGLYFLIGQRMHEGLLPYVDIWDRKPFGLFLIFYAIAGFSDQPVAYQIAAALFASSTGCVIYATALRWTKRSGALLAGVLYVAALNAVEGMGGQTPVFYNLFIAIAVNRLASWIGQIGPPSADGRVWAAMAACGVALTIKQTVVFESAYLGSFVLWRLWRAGASPIEIGRTALIAGAIGAVPTLACLGYFYLAGHFEVFWHAMYSSNLSKAYPDLKVMGARALIQLLTILPLFVPAILALALPGDLMRKYRGFLSGWLIAALVGLASVPNFYLHYALPLTAPMAVIAADFLSRRILGPVLALALVAYTGALFNPFDFAWTRASQREMARLSALINTQDPGNTMLVYEGPVYLYQTTNRRFLSPLVFPNHLNHLIERDVSHLDTNEEIERVLALRPDVIVTRDKTRSNPVNAEGQRLIERWAQANCGSMKESSFPEIFRRWKVKVYLGCGDTDTRNFGPPPPSPLSESESRPF